jgi:hypothetical protein
VGKARMDYDLVTKVIGAYYAEQRILYEDNLCSVVMEKDRLKLFCKSKNKADRKHALQCLMDASKVIHGPIQHQPRLEGDFDTGYIAIGRTDP